MFTLSEENRFLLLFDIRSGNATFGGKVLPVLYKDAAQMALSEAVQEGELTEDDAQSIFLQVVGAGVCQDFASLVRKVSTSDFRTDGFVSDGNFVLDLCSYYSPHGSVRTIQDIPGPVAYHTLEQLFHDLLGAVLTCDLAADVAARVFKQAVDFELPLDDVEKERRTRELLREVHGRG